MNGKKILIYNWTPYTGEMGGGVTVYIRNLINYFQETYEECKFYFLSSGWKYNFDKDYTYIEKDTNQPNSNCICYSVVNSPVVASQRYMARNPENIFKDVGLKSIFEKFIEEHGPFSAIHFNNMEGLSVDVFSLKEKFSNTKFIFSLHNYMPICPRVNLFDYSRGISCTSFENGNNCIKCAIYDNAKNGTQEVLGRVKKNNVKENAVSVWLEKLHLDNLGKSCEANYYTLYRSENIAALNRYMDKILAVSQRTHDIALQYGFSKDKLQLCYIGTQVASKQIGFSCNDDTRFKIAYLGYSKQHEKGFPFLLNALSKLPKEISQKIDVLVAAKDIDKETVQSTLSAFHTVDIYKGYVHEQLPSLLKDVSLGIIPVLWEDNLPQVAIEMVAYGVPILASDLGGASELTEDNRFKFKAGDIKDFIEHLLLFVENPSLLNCFWAKQRPLTTMKMHVRDLLPLYQVVSGEYGEVEEVKAPKVSVIIPVYNAEKYISQTINDLLNQTLQEIEIICIVDGARDRSLSILREFEQIDKRIKVIVQKNKGAGAARNVGLSLAQGVYLSFLDADDLFEKDMLFSAYKAAQKQGADITLFLSDQYNNETHKLSPAPWVLKRKNFPNKNPFSSDDIPEKIFNLGNAWAWDKLYRHEFVKQHNLQFQELRTSNDMLFVQSAYAMAKCIYVLESVLVHQRVNLKNSLSVTREKSWDCFYKALTGLQEFLLQHDKMVQFERSFCNWAIDFSTWQYKTLKGIAHVKAYQLLHDKAFEQFGITHHNKEYFYVPEQYEIFEKIMSQDPVTYAWEYAEKYFKSSALSVENIKRPSKNENVDKRVQELCNDLKAIHNSKSFRIGRAITFLPRKIRGGYQCCSDHGLKYTIYLSKRKFIECAKRAMR